MQHFCWCAASGFSTDANEVCNTFKLAFTLQQWWGKASAFPVAWQVMMIVVMEWGKINGLAFVPSQSAGMAINSSKQHPL